MMANDLFNESTENEETIRDIAIKLVEAKYKDGQNTDNAPILFIMGSDSCGKSSLINNFLDRDDKAKPTLTLEYTYGRKNVIGQFSDKNVCHIWELGGNLFQTPDIYRVPLHMENCLNTTIFIMIDLTNPKTIWVTIESCLEKLNDALKDHPLAGKLRQKWKENNSTNLKTLYSTVDMIPMPVYIVGGKYDLFKDMDNTYKKIVNKTLRSVAVILEAGLFYYSNSDQIIMRKSKEMMNSIGFKIPHQIKTSKDVSKPLFIEPRNDSWENIGEQSVSWESLKLSFVGKFPQESFNATIPDDPSLDPAFREPMIDALRSQKDEEIKLFSSMAVWKHI